MVCLPHRAAAFMVIQQKRQAIIAERQCFNLPWLLGVQSSQRVMRDLIAPHKGGPHQAQNMVALVHWPSLRISSSEILTASASRCAGVKAFARPRVRARSNATS